MCPSAAIKSTPIGGQWACIPDAIAREISLRKHWQSMQNPGGWVSVTNQRCGWLRGGGLASQCGIWTLG
jgi:hypothetical protein